MKIFSFTFLQSYHLKFIIHLFNLSIIPFFIAILSPLNCTLWANSHSSETGINKETYLKQEFIRVIPDQRVQFAPNLVTSIDLLDTYNYLIEHSARTDSTPHQLEFSLENSSDNKSDKKTAETKIENNKLIIKWKKIGKSNLTLKIINTANPSIEYFDKIKLEAWTFNYWRMTLTLLGGIGIFLLGMKYLSDGLQLVAGPSLRKMVATVTDNRFTAILVGITATVAV
ncbi:MAG: hypothetical protein LBC74_15620, partial [Planctomycetaceae bacterium]|nr:hypothetical protein [Planctomycetaceae bacterium]